MNRRTIAAIIALFLMLCTSGAFGQAQPLKKISFTLAVIHASGDKGELDLDPQLKDIKVVLEATGYKKFKLLKSRPYSQEHMSQFGEPLVEGYQCTMVAMLQADGSPSVQIAISHKSNKKKAILKTVVPLKKGKPVLVQGPKLSDGGVLLLCVIGR